MDKEPFVGKNRGNGRRQSASRANEHLFLGGEGEGEMWLKVGAYVQKGSFSREPSPFFYLYPGEHRRPYVRQAKNGELYYNTV